MGFPFQAQFTYANMDFNIPAIGREGNKDFKNLKMSNKIN